MYSSLSLWEVFTYAHLIMSPPASVMWYSFSGNKPITLMLTLTIVWYLELYFYCWDCGSRTHLIRAKILCTTAIPSPNVCSAEQLKVKYYVQPKNFTMACSSNGSRTRTPLPEHQIFKDVNFLRLCLNHAHKVFRLQGYSLYAFIIYDIDKLSSALLSFIRLIPSPS